VKAGEISITGDTTWTAGLDVSLTVIGGGADPATGTTDANGQFSSLISLNPLTDTVEVVVRVASSFAEFASETVVATTPIQHQSMFTASVSGAIVGIPSDGSRIDTLIANTLINGGYYSWSPDGSKVATQNGYVFSVGGGVQQLSESNLGQPISWSPDGSMVYRSAVRNPRQTNDSVIILAVPTNGSPSFVLYGENANSQTVDSTIGYGGPVVYNIGSRIAFPRFAYKLSAGSSGTRSIQSVNQAGGDRIELLTQPVARQGGSILFLSLSADDSKIAFTVTVHDTTQGRILDQVQILSVGTGQATRVSPSQPENNVFNQYNLIDIFPSGLSVLASRKPATNLSFDYVVLNPSSSSIQSTILSLPSAMSIVSSPAISGDGTMVAIILRGAGNMTNLVIKDLQGNTIGQSPSLVNMFTPHWRP